MNHQICTLELFQNNFQYIEISISDPDLYKICILDLDTYSNCGSGALKKDEKMSKYWMSNSRHTPHYGLTQRMSSRRSPSLKSDPTLTHPTMHNFNARCPTLCKTKFDYTEFPPLRLELYEAFHRTLLLENELRWTISWSNQKKNHTLDT